MKHNLNLYKKIDENTYATKIKVFQDRYKMWLEEANEQLLRTFNARSIVSDYQQMKVRNLITGQMEVGFDNDRSFKFEKSNTPSRAYTFSKNVVLQFLSTKIFKSD